MDLIGTEIVVSGHYARTIEDPLESTLFRSLIAQPSPGEFVEKVFAFPTKSITANMGLVKLKESHRTAERQVVSAGAAAADASSRIDANELW